MIFASTEEKVPDDWSRDGQFIVFESFNQKQNGTCCYCGLLTKAHHPCCSRISMNVRHSSHPTENISRTLLTNLALLQSMFERSRFQVVSGGSQRTSEHNRDGEVTVASFSISVRIGKLMVVEVKLGPPFQAGVPKPLFDTRVLT